jgi:AcrR family transcriptional regulator
VTSDDTQTAQIRAVRADVRRNRARLLAAAREMFERDGAGGSLEGVARLAGVGIGTLYRHFPTRQDLLEALLADVYDGLAVRGRELLESPEPGEALTEWLRGYIAGTTAFPGMAASAVVSLREDRTDPCPSCRAAREAGEALFVRAQKAGDVPADVAFADALRLAGAIAVVTEDEPEAADRLLALASAGMIASGDPCPAESA